MMPSVYYKAYDPMNMVKRSGYRQTCHNTAISRSAAQYISNGYKVWADISGYPTPQNLTVDGVTKRPDIIAKKGKDVQIIEWETPESLDKDHEQHRVLRTWARRNGAHFHVRVCNV